MSLIRKLDTRLNAVTGVKVTVCLILHYCNHHSPVQQSDMPTSGPKEHDSRG
ncbi:hypothetical protein M378DRAFT_162607 [Amanita muscaria Koide BX008]|uniref:Uncharacterized protein n=1 Tax=Amanita muscaria (strain Koide BX008) TaxID=946122 RepID=A0A0C2TE07_AMAMK|nr:hypothetical protein M378DRAFT_162607 [Amanita muscaria Koide BX008]